MGVGAAVLGYADPDVDRAVTSAIAHGVACTLNAPEEVELSRLLLSLHPWAGMCRFAKTGGEAMSIAIRIARAKTKRDVVAFCGYHGWHDWYLSANLASRKNLDGHLLSGLPPLGVPRVLRGTALPFRYNHPEELSRIAAKHRLAAVVVEPIRHTTPREGFLQKVRAIAKKNGAVLIFDEVSSGFRLTHGGSHLMLKVAPDIAVFAKAISNGFPMAAVIGTRRVMRAAERTFISSTAWTERVGVVAALATIQKYKARRVHQHLKRIGAAIGEGWRQLAKKHGLHIRVEGPEALITFSFEYGKTASVLKTLFTQEMLNRGFLAGQTVYVSYAHTPRDVRAYLRAVNDVFALLARAIRSGSVQSCLKGRVAQQGFSRLVS
jgi:glutamate-1-semialdehyde aminotransferase